MKASQDDIDILIAKFLSGEASEEEKNTLNQWRSLDVRNDKQFSDAKFIHQRTASRRYDADSAWDKVKSRLDDKKVRALNQPEINRSGWVMKIAATLLAIALFTYGITFLLKQKPEGYQTVATINTVTDTLPGGTQVFLNKQTSITYRFDKKKNAHIAAVNGEAFFEVNNSDGKKLLIETQGLVIEDIGTSFNVKSYNDSSLVEVYVEDGAVKFYSEKDSGIYLQKGGKGVFDKKAQQFYVAQPDINAIAYKTKRLQFEETFLKVVVDKVNALYDQKIIIPKHLQNCKLTVSFDNESIDEIAAIIAETLELTVTTNGDRILLEGDGCVSQ